LSSTTDQAQQDTITLGEIKKHLAPLIIDGAGLSTLGFAPVGKRRAAKLYRKSDLPLILTALIQRLESLRKLH
jgi:hypothetical protein